MTLYVGEQVRIAVTAREYATAGSLGTLITDENFISVKITILNKDQTVLVDDASMLWDDDEAIWEYKWDTDIGSPPLASGSYPYRVTVVGVDGKPSIEWGKVRLARQTSIVV